MRLFQSGVEKRQQLVSQLQILANDVFVVFSEAPGLLIVAIDHFVIAAERRQKTHLISAHQQLTIATTDESAHIAANKRLAR